MMWLKVHTPDKWHLQAGSPQDKSPAPDEDVDSSTNAVPESALPRWPHPLMATHHWDACAGCGYDSITTCFWCGSHLCSECQLRIVCNCERFVCFLCLAEATGSQGHTYMGFRESADLGVSNIIYYAPGLAPLHSPSTSFDISTDLSQGLAIGTDTGQELALTQAIEKLIQLEKRARQLQMWEQSFNPYAAWLLLARANMNITVWSNRTWEKAACDIRRVRRLGQTFALFRLGCSCSKSMSKNNF